MPCVTVYLRSFPDERYTGKLYNEAREILRAIKGSALEVPELKLVPDDLWVYFVPTCFWEHEVTKVTIELLEKPKRTPEALKRFATAVGNAVRMCANTPVVVFTHLQNENAGFCELDTPQA